MTKDILTFQSCFKSTKPKTSIPVRFLSSKEVKKQSGSVKTQLLQSGFEGKAGQVCGIRDKSGKLDQIIAGRIDTFSPYDSAAACNHILKNLSKDIVKKTVFTLEGLNKKDLTAAYVGWGWACYSFDRYKKDKTVFPSLYLPKSAPTHEVKAQVESVHLLRNLVNTPANDLGTAELEAVVKKIATQFKVKTKSIVDKELLKQNFPMLYHVGKASQRKPRLVELNWGKAKDPKLVIVGKGIVYDTGGLNLKPPRFMRLMKKDMGGAAHAIGLAYLIMALKLPVNLKLIVCAAENSVDGNAFRPGDVLETRAGHTVEIGDTDAEGRLAIADALTYAGESKPDLIIDYCTLTGAARVALGPDIPALFANKDKTAQDIVKVGMSNHDPVWQLPLWAPYFKSYSSDVADFANDGDGYGGAIKAGLFLQKFAGDNTDWVHLDCFAWSQSDTPGRPKGGADNGMRAVFHYLQKRYS